MTMLRQEGPRFVAVTRTDGVWLLPVDARTEFLTKWMAGASFWVGLDRWGKPTVIKLGDIVGCVEHTDASIALGEEEEAELRHREMLNGNDSFQ